MSDVFICYSRSERSFVERLAQALETRGLSTGVDWEDVRPAQSFMDAIYSAIEGAAETFLFLLSPAGPVRNDAGASGRAGHAR